MNANERVVYSLTVQDLQDVAVEYLERKLSKKEIGEIEKNLWRFISWDEAIQNTIDFNFQIGERDKTSNLDNLS